MDEHGRSVDGSMGDKVEGSSLERVSSLIHALRDEQILSNDDEGRWFSRNFGPTPLPVSYVESISRKKTAIGRFVP